MKFRFSFFHCMSLFLDVLLLNVGNTATAGNVEDFFSAAHRGNLEEVTRLISQVNIEAKGAGHSKASALILATRARHVQVVDYLLRQKANPNSKDSHGKTALSFAAQAGREDLIVLLLKYGANPNLQDYNGRSPRQWAKSQQMKNLLTEGPPSTPRHQTPAPSSVGPVSAERHRQGPSICDDLLDFRKALPDQHRRAACQVFVPPLNSSGDIYWILSYLLLAQHHECWLPKVQFFYDGSDQKIQPTGSSGLNVLTQVKRSLAFASALGLSDSFLDPKRLDRLGEEQGKKGSTWASSRDKASLEALVKAQVPCAVDQKALSALVVAYFHHHVPLTAQKGARDQNPAAQTLRQAYQAAFEASLQQLENEKMSAVLLEILKGYQEKITTGKQEEEKEAVLFTHLRYSNKANPRQNVEDALLGPLTRYGEAQKYRVFHLLADSRKQQSFRGVDQDERVSPFFDSQSLETKFEEDERFLAFGKLLHLGMMLSLRDWVKVVGIIGNTSGTLDLAALLGYPVYDFHQFEEKKSLSYQDYRILLQSNLMSVGAWGSPPEYEGNIKNWTPSHQEITRWIGGNFLQGFLNRLPLFPAVSFSRPQKYETSSYADLVSVMNWQEERSGTFQNYLIPGLRPLLEWADEQYHSQD